MSFVLPIKSRKTTFARKLFDSGGTARIGERPVRAFSIHMLPLSDRAGWLFLEEKAT
jgi:hypothetical protein